MRIQVDLAEIRMAATQTLCELPPMAGQKKTPDRDRIDLRADKEWIARVETQAKRLGTGLSAYIREAVTRKLEADESSAPTQNRRRSS